MFGASSAAAEKPVGEASMTGTARSAAAITLVNRIEAGDGAMDPVAVDQAAVDVAFLDRAAVDLDAHARSGAPRMEELVLATRMELPIRGERERETEKESHVEVPERTWKTAVREDKAAVMVS